MQPKSEFWRRLAAAPAKALALVGGIVMFAMMVHICADVVARYVFNHPLPGTLEITAGYELTAIVLLPLAYVTLERRHIVAELFTRGASSFVRALLDIVIGIAGVLYTGLLAWQTGLSAIDSWRLGEVWETSSDVIVIWPSRWVLPLAFGLTALYMAGRVVTAVRALARRHRADTP